MLLSGGVQAARDVDDEGSFNSEYIDLSSPRRNLATQRERRSSRAKERAEDLEEFEDSQGGGSKSNNSSSGNINGDDEHWHARTMSVGNMAHSRSGGDDSRDNSREGKRKGSGGGGGRRRKWGTRGRRQTQVVDPIARSNYEGLLGGAISPNRIEDGSESGGGETRTLTEGELSPSLMNDLGATWVEEDQMVGVEDGEIHRYFGDKKMVNSRSGGDRTSASSTSPHGRTANNNSTGGSSTGGSPNPKRSPTATRTFSFNDSHALRRLASGNSFTAKAAGFNKPDGDIDSMEMGEIVAGNGRASSRGDEDSANSPTNNQQSGTSDHSYGSPTTIPAISMGVYGADEQAGQQTKVRRNVFTDGNVTRSSVAPALQAPKLVVENIDHQTDQQSSETTNTATAMERKPSGLVYSYPHHDKRAQELRDEVREFQEAFKHQQPSPESLLKNRLLRTNLLEAKSNRLVNRLCFFAFFGILLMIIENEVRWDYNLAMDSMAVVSMKSAITLSTVLLLIELTRFYHTRWLLLKVKNVLMNDEVYWSLEFITRFLIEVVVCAIHSPPMLVFQYRHEYTKSVSEFGNTRLDMLMFFRLYLLVRFIKARTKLQGSAARFIGALNNVAFDTAFTLKVQMTQRPFLTLFSLLGTLIVCTSYIVRICERDVQPVFGYWPNALWLLVVTITTVGYGDVVPVTTCGRMASMSCAWAGVFFTTSMIAILQKNLDFTKPEARVYNFLTKAKTRSTLFDLAATAIQTVWRSHAYRRKNKRSRAPYTLRQHTIETLTNWHNMRKMAKGSQDNEGMTSVLVENIWFEVRDLADGVWDLYDGLQDVAEMQEDLLMEGHRGCRSFRSDVQSDNPNAQNAHLTVDYHVSAKSSGSQDGNKQIGIGDNGEQDKSESSKNVSKMSSSDSGEDLDSGNSEEHEHDVDEYDAETRVPRSAKSAKTDVSSIEPKKKAYRRNPRLMDGKDRASSSGELQRALHKRESSGNVTPLLREALSEASGNGTGRGKRQRSNTLNGRNTERVRKSIEELKLDEPSTRSPRRRDGQSIKANSDLRQLKSRMDFLEDNVDHIKTMVSLLLQANNIDVPELHTRSLFSGERSPNRSRSESPDGSHLSELSEN
eukprot:TRINITY_DN5005_c0_g1_i5.p1 TRINITY_DN5005_c0_g1~~TRINITY_DN5005_c0_g1_i5.p1  ORF type:complete len:1112 (+),score=325.20 TRINITY_DN5005_c0_g1_i5:81-3416(+)